MSALLSAAHISSQQPVALVLQDKCANLHTHKHTKFDCMRETLYSIHIATGFRKSKIRKAKRFPFPFFLLRGSSSEGARRRGRQNRYDTMGALMSFYAPTLDGNFRGSANFFYCDFPIGERAFSWRRFAGLYFPLKGWLHTFLLNHVGQHPLLVPQCSAGRHEVLDSSFLFILHPLFGKTGKQATHFRAGQGRTWVGTLKRSTHDSGTFSIPSCLSWKYYL